MVFSTSNTTLLRDFFHEGGIYFHFIAVNHGDMVILTDFDYKPLLRYTASGIVEEITDQDLPDVLNPKKYLSNPIGRVSLRDDNWIYIDNQDTITTGQYTINQVEGVLDFEVQISKQWLSKAIPLNT